jgi:anti-sigma B factor antagonist
MSMSRPAARGGLPQLTASIKGSTGPVTRLGASGELDLATAGAFGALLADVITPDRPSVVIDASRLRFCDSHGLAVLEMADALAGTCGGTVTLTRVRPLVAKVLRITGLDERFVGSAPR